MNQTWWGNKTTLITLIVIMAALMSAVGCNGFNPRGNGEDQDHPEELGVRLKDTYTSTASSRIWCLK